MIHYLDLNIKNEGALKTKAIYFKVDSFFTCRERRMKIYDIDKNYIAELQKNDPIILNPTGAHYKHERKYLGVIFQINGCDYFIPLSSPDKVDDYINGKIRKSSKVVIRMTRIDKNNKESLLGTIRLNAMFPLYNKSVIINYDLNAETDLAYKDLIINELEFINENRDNILKKAKDLYRLKTRQMKIPMLNYVCDFLKLEEVAKKYK